MSAETEKVAVVTGASRGIGLEVCRQLAKKGIRVLLTSRDEGKGRTAVHMLKSEGLDLNYYPLDVTDATSVSRLYKFVSHEIGRLDILVNNAGIYLDSSDNPEGISILTAEIELIRKSMETNTYGPIRMIQGAVPLMKKQNYGRIVNISSGMAQLSEMNGGWPGYRLSKVALNAVTRICADELKGTSIQINSVCPGWVKTSMGGPDAELSVEEGADTVVWLATLEKPVSGKFFRERKEIAW